MLVGFIGRMGQGKTLSMTIVGAYLHKVTGAKLMARHAISLPGAEQVRKVSQVWDTDNAIFLWDELWIDMDSRDWGNNIDLTRFIQQSRKKNAFIAYTAQHYSQVEKRVRKATDILIFCERFDIVDKKTKEKRKEHRLVITEPYTGRVIGIRVIKTPEIFYGLYDTNEVIPPLKNDLGKKDYSKKSYPKR